MSNTNETCKFCGFTTDDEVEMDYHAEKCLHRVCDENPELWDAHLAEHSDPAEMETEPVQQKGVPRELSYADRIVGEGMDIGSVLAAHEDALSRMQAILDDDLPLHPTRQGDILANGNAGQVVEEKKPRVSHSASSEQTPKARRMLDLDGNEYTTMLTEEEMDNIFARPIPDISDRSIPPIIARNMDLMPCASEPLMTRQTGGSSVQAMTTAFVTTSTPRRRYKSSTVFQEKGKRKRGVVFEFEELIGSDLEPVRKDRALNTDSEDSEAEELDFIE